MRPAAPFLHLQLKIATLSTIAIDSSGSPMFVVLAMLASFKSHKMSVLSKEQE